MLCLSCLQCAMLLSHIKSMHTRSQTPQSMCSQLKRYLTLQHTQSFISFLSWLQSSFLPFQRYSRILLPFGPKSHPSAFFGLYFCSGGGKTKQNQLFLLLNMEHSSEVRQLILTLEYIQQGIQATEGRVLKSQSLPSTLDSILL